MSKENIKSDYTLQKRRVPFGPIISNTALIAGATFIETVRAGLVNPRSLPADPNNPLPPILSQDNPLFEPLAHSGDLFDGVFISLVSGLFCEAGNKLQSKVTKRRLPRWATRCAGSMIGLLMVAGVETNLFSTNTEEWDTYDIPIGVLGSVGAPIAAFLIEKKVASVTRKETKIE